MNQLQLPIKNHWSFGPFGWFSFWLPYLQPVRNEKNEPVAKLPRTRPLVAYDPGDVTVSMPGGTMIEVIER